MEGDSSTKVSTWNVRGLGKLHKLKQVMTRLKHLKSMVIFLQESHLLSSDVLKVSRWWLGQVYSASFSSNARGVITLIHKSLPFQVVKTLPDPAGRYLILQDSLFNENIKMVNLYGPNDDCPKFFEHLFLLLASLPGKLVEASIAQSLLTLITLRARTHLICRVEKHCSILYNQIYVTPGGDCFLITENSLVVHMYPLKNWLLFGVQWSLSENNRLCLWLHSNLRIYT